jgi:hypothetical protein
MVIALPGPMTDFPDIGKPNTVKAAATAVPL